MTPALRSPVLRSRAARLAPLLAALLLASCADRHSIEVGSIPDDYRTRHPIVVGEDEVALELPVASSGTRLSVADRGRIADFAAGFLASKSSAMRLLVPEGSPNTAAASLASRDAVNALRRSGVPGNRILIQPYAAHRLGPTAPLRLSYATLVARTEPCGRWPEDLGSTHENKNYFNFGCASQQNLAAQVADPRDLLGPRGRDPIDAARRTDMIEKYRTGANPNSARPTNSVGIDF